MAAIKKVGVFAVLAVALLMFSSVAFSAAASSSASDSLSQLLSAVGAFLAGFGSSSTTITGYQVSETIVCPAKITAKSDKSSYVKGESGTFTVNTYDSAGSPSYSKVAVKYNIAGIDYNGELITNPSGTFSTGITAMGAAVGVYSYTFSSPSGCGYVSATLTYEVVDASTAPAPTPAPTPVVVKEQVKCAFMNSAYLQKCYSNDGRFSCSGTGTCVAGVSGDKGTKLTWKSSCGGYAYTVIDEVNEQAEFKCEATPTPTPVCTDSDGGSNYYVKGVSSDGKTDYPDYCS